MQILDHADLYPRADLAYARQQVQACDDASVAVAREQVLTFIDAHDDALLRTCVPGHVTSSAFVYDRGRDRFVLLHHAKLRKWLQPGGHADGDANLPAVALREASEETGIDGLRVATPVLDIDVHRVEPPNETAHLHHDVRFLVLAPEGALLRGNHESTDLRWCTMDDLDAFGCDDSVRRLVRAGRRMALD